MLEYFFVEDICEILFLTFIFNSYHFILTARTIRRNSQE